MAEHDEHQRVEALRRKQDEIRQKALAEELSRLDSLAASRVGELLGARRSEEESRLRELMDQAAARRSAAEKALAILEPQVMDALESALAIRSEARRREEETLRKKAEEDRARQEAAKKKAEEEARLKAEAEQRRIEAQKKKAEEEARLRAEAEQRRKKEEERQRAEIERKKKEEEQRKTLEAEAKRKREEDEKRKREEQARLEAEEELRRKEEELRQKQEEERLRAEAEERERARLAEEARERERKEREHQEQLARAKAAQEKPAPTATELEGLPPVGDEAAAEVTLPEPEAPSQADRKGRKREKNAPLAKGTSPREASSGKKKMRLPLVLVAAILLVAVLVGGYLFLQLKRSVFPNVTMIAVAPWTSASSGDDAAIASALAEEVAREMEQAPTPAVLGFGTARALDRGNDPVKAAVALGYPYVLHGSLTRANDSYTFSLRLVDSTGDAAWEKSYTRGAEGLATLAEEVIGEVRAALRLPASPSGSKPSTSPTAYLLYLKGLSVLQAQRPEELKDAYALFDQAAAQEPEFSEALAAKARTIVLAYEAERPIEGTTLEDAKKLSADAIANSPTSASGYLARGMAFDQLKQYRMAFQQLENALQRSPNNAEAYLAKARVHLKVGQHEDGMNALTSAFRLSPRDPAVLTLIAQTYQLARATKEGFAYHQMALQCVADTTAHVAGPMADAILTDASLTLTQADRVAAALQRVVEAHPDDYRAIYRLARLYQVSGKALEAMNLLGTAEGIIKTLLVAQPQDAEAAATLALILTRQGKFTDAVPLAQRLLASNPGNARIAYRVAQMYALQMYSGKTLSVDEPTKKLCIETLQSALAADYRFEELANGDFYNMYEHGDFSSVIQVPLR